MRRRNGKRKRLGIRRLAPIPRAILALVSQNWK
jgi:hypothetical protein